MKGFGERQVTGRSASISAQAGLKLTCFWLSSSLQMPSLYSPAESHIPCSWIYGHSRSLKFVKVHTLGVRWGISYGINGFRGQYFTWHIHHNKKKKQRPLPLRVIHDFPLIKSRLVFMTHLMDGMWQEDAVACSHLLETCPLDSFLLKSHQLRCKKPQHVDW